MSSTWKKIQKNAENFAVKEYYKNMTPEMYQDGIQRAIKATKEKCLTEYQMELSSITKQYNESIQHSTLMAMDTLTVEILYELGNMLECYKDEPEHLNQKIDIIQKLYETAMTSIGNYADRKIYKTDKQAQKAFAKKKKTIQKIFGIYGGDK